MKTFTVNGKQFEAKPFTFNDVCKFEDMGINLIALGDISNAKLFSLIRAYLSICMGIPSDRVGEVANEFDVEEVMECFSYSIEESGFFRALGKRTEEKTSKTQSKK